MLLLSKKEMPQYSKLLNVLFAIKTPCNCVTLGIFLLCPEVLSCFLFLGFFLGK